MLFRSALPGETLILPGHASTPVPFDGVPLLTTLASANEQIDFLQVERADFVQMVLRKLPATPANYQRIVVLNEQGVLPEESATELEAGANRCAIS